MSRPSTIATWNRNPAEEEAMGAAHAPIWRRMIDVAVPHDLSASTILDYGCNQGGFLRLLYDRQPYKAAVGIDIARESVARAELLKGHRPVEYKVADSAASLGRTFDFAFSHEVIYLLPDIARHASDMRQALRPGGAYVAAMGCHTDSSLWPRWRSLIAETSSIPIYDHSLEDVARAFTAAGFAVAVRPLALDAFMPVTLGSAYFPRIADQLRYYSEDKVLFRFVRSPSSGVRMPVVTAFYAALTGLLCVVLADLVIRQRLKKRISVGDGGDPALSGAVRAFGNFIEYAPLVIALLALAELLGVSRVWLHAYGTAFVLSRVVHAIGMSVTLKANAGRTVGIAATHLVLISLAVSLLTIAVPKL